MPTSSSPTGAPANAPGLGAGILHWMERSVAELHKAVHDLAPDPVHDLRVAIRRSRSMGEAFRGLDPHPAWKKMRSAGQAIFAPLGELRDTQVMIEWLDKLGQPQDPVTVFLRGLFADREARQKDVAATALRNFDERQWLQWAQLLSVRAAQLPPGDPIFTYLALERWNVAHQLHRLALRNRGKAAFHELRIGIKKLRYIVENFLPAQNEQWGKDLRKLQDLLGEVHDLDVLGQTAISSGAFSTPALRAHWQARLRQEREQRLRAYRGSMTGKASLWPRWRADLPTGDALQAIGVRRARAIVSFMAADLSHAERVSGLALELYDGLTAAGCFHGQDQDPTPRRVLHMAALLHGIGRTQVKKKYQKASARLLRRMDAPLEWPPADWQMTALVARYHRGSLPNAGQKRFAHMLPERQQMVRELAGVLRLAARLDRMVPGVGRLTVERSAERIVLSAAGFDPAHPQAEKLAASRCLLETVLGLPVLITTPDHQAHTNAVPAPRNEPSVPKTLTVTSRG